jgi:hypothetical protein
MARALPEHDPRLRRDKRPAILLAHFRVKAFRLEVDMRLAFTLWQRRSCHPTGRDAGNSCRYPDEKMIH